VQNAPNLVRAPPGEDGGEKQQAKRTEVGEGRRLTGGKIRQDRLHRGHKSIGRRWVRESSPEATNGGLWVRTEGLGFLRSNRMHGLGEKP